MLISVLVEIRVNICHFKQVSSIFNIEEELIWFILSFNTSGALYIDFSHFKTSFIYIYIGKIW